MFSRLASELPGRPNPLYAIHAALRARGVSIRDQISGNVNDHGIRFPENVLQEILDVAVRESRVYAPDSLGQATARDAIAAFYGSPGVPARHIVLTPGTSVSYWYAFKLLADPGDQILCPAPSYPLFGYIASMCGVELVHYRLTEGVRWSIDIDYLEAHVTTRTRAIVLISPHNPTGAVATPDEVEALAAVARRHSLPIIADEVFSEFLFTGMPLARPLATDAPLVLTLNGFSKMFALPGFKIGWIAVTGDATRVSEALGALELISDTFLPVNEIAQFSVQGIFRRGRPFLEEYRRWVRTCRDTALEALSGCDGVPPEGGFYLSIPLRSDEEQAATRLLEHAHILTHPGFFYDMKPDHLVTTFIGEPGVVRENYTAIREAAGWV